MIRFRVLFFFISVLWISGLINFNAHTLTATHCDSFFTSSATPGVELTYSLHIPFLPGNLLTDMVEQIVINENNSLGQRNIQFNSPCVCSPNKRTAFLAQYTLKLQENQLQRNTILFNCRLQI